MYYRALGWIGKWMDWGRDTANTWAKARKRGRYRIFFSSNCQHGCLQIEGSSIAWNKRIVYPNVCYQKKYVWWPTFLEITKFGWTRNPDTSYFQLSRSYQASFSHKDIAITANVAQRHPLTQSVSLISFNEVFQFVLRRDNSCYGGQESLWSWVYDDKPNKYISLIRLLMNGVSVYGKWIPGPECLLAFAAWNQHPFQMICLNMLLHITFVHCLLSTYFTFIGCFPLDSV